MYQNIIHNMLCHELRHRPSDYMSGMRDIGIEHRLELINYMIGIWDIHKLRFKTLSLAVNYFDRYLALRPRTPKDELQNLGCACLFIASKFEEIYELKLMQLTEPTYMSYLISNEESTNEVTKVRSRIQFHNKFCDKIEIIRMETDIIDTLNFGVYATVIADFLPSWFQIMYRGINGLRSMDARRLVWYLATLCLLDYELSIKFQPSKIAICIMVVVMYHYTDNIVYPDELRLLSGYNMYDLTSCVSRIWDVWCNTVDRRGGFIGCIPEIFGDKRWSWTYNVIPRSKPNRMYMSDDERNVHMKIYNEIAYAHTTPTMIPLIWAMP